MSSAKNASECVAGQDTPIGASRPDIAERVLQYFQ